VLRAFALGLSYAHVSPMLPPEERRLADGAVDEAYPLLFAHLLTDAAWLQRSVELPTHQAKEAARHFAFDALRRLRQTAALLGHAVELHARGPSRERADGYVERMRAALFVEVSPGRSLYDVAPELPEPAILRGHALEHALFEQLRARFNEDFWRNPSAGSWLLSRFREGRREDAPELAARLGLGPPSLAASGMRLVSVMAG